VIITNTDDFADVVPAEITDAKPGDRLIDLL
jgi:hypothetical protein